jgi:malonyl-CoA O-methyltransferase
MSGDPHSPAGALDARAVRRSFSRAALTYDDAAVLQREVGMRMAQRLDVVRLDPGALLDAGSGTGTALADLALRFPNARRYALDVALPMLAAARLRNGAAVSGWGRFASLVGIGVRQAAAPDYVCADLQKLPFAAASFDLVWSNLALQWVNDLPHALAEMSRVLRVGGLLSFTTLGPDTLKEIRTSFAGIDRHTPVNRFIDMHDVGDMLVHAGFADPVTDMEHLTLTYGDAGAMMRELKALGASNMTVGRPRGLMGRERWRRFRDVLERTRRNGRIPATFEVIYGHAWKSAPTRTAEGLAIVKVERRSRPHDGDER